MSNYEKLLNIKLSIIISKRIIEQDNEIFV